MIERSSSPSGVGLQEFNETSFFPNDGVSIATALQSALLLALTYYLGSIIGFDLTPREMPISLFWPANAILLAALLVVRPRLWWVLLLAVLPAHLLAQTKTGIPLRTTFGSFGTNVGEALIGAVCVRSFTAVEALFQRVRGVLVFLAFGVVLAPLASSFAHAAIAAGSQWGNGYWTLWRARLFSNMLAALTLTPTIILVFQNGRSWIQHASRSRILEGLELIALIILVSILVFGNVEPSSPALMFTLLPLLVWIVVRFGAIGIYPSLLAISLISMWDAMHGRHPFMSVPTRESALALQIFLIATSLPMVLLAAALAERRAVGESLHQSRANLIHAQEQERHRIARELHDDVGQQLTVLEVELNHLKRQPEQASAACLDKLHSQASAAAAAIRTISHDLHPAGLEFLGVVPAIRHLCETVAEETPIKVTFAEGSMPAVLDPQVSLCLYRVAQEALQNIVRHSHASKAEVHLDSAPENISLGIVDNGVGMDGRRNDPTALGLISMRERVSLAGGSFRIDSQSMRGTSIEVRIPLRRFLPSRQQTKTL